MHTNSKNNDDNDDNDPSNSKSTVSVKSHTKLTTVETNQHLYMHTVIKGGPGSKFDWIPWSQRSPAEKGRNL